MLDIEQLTRLVQELRLKLSDSLCGPLADGCHGTTIRRTLTQLLRKELLDADATAQRHMCSKIGNTEATTPQCLLDTIFAPL